MFNRCCLCGETYTHFGHNPWPLSERERMTAAATTATTQKAYGPAHETHSLMLPAASPLAEFMHGATEKGGRPLFCGNA
jgi:hypothetical protein